MDIMRATKFILSIFLLGIVSNQSAKEIQATDPLQVDRDISLPDIPIGPLQPDYGQCKDQKWEFNPRDDTRCRKKGTTWAWYQHNCNFNIDNVGCEGLPLAPTKSGGCDPYNGDTNCNLRKPILCLNKQQINRPPYSVDCSAHAMPKEFYCGWTGAFLNLTPPVQGCLLRSPDIADKICRYFFGCGWQMAAHGDGWWTSGMSDTSFYGNSWIWDQTGG